MEYIAQRAATCFIIGLILSAASWARQDQSQRPTTPRQRAEVAYANPVKATSAGLNVDVTVSHATRLNCGIWTVLKLKTGSDAEGPPVTTSILVDLPKFAQNTENLTFASVLIPVAVAADSSRKYTINCTARGETSDESALASVSFNGYSPLITDTIKFSFQATGLLISAKTNEKADLYAKWQKTEEQTEPITWSADAPTRLDPRLTLSYPDIDSSTKTLSETVPLIVALRGGDGIVQEARITLAIDVPKDAPAPPDTSKKKKSNKVGDIPQTLQEQIKVIQDQNTPNSQKEKVTFSWKQLATTGLGAMLKYFAPLL